MGPIVDPFWDPADVERDARRYNENLLKHIVKHMVIEGSRDVGGVKQTSKKQCLGAVTPETPSEHQNVTKMAPKGDPKWLPNGSQNDVKIALKQNGLKLLILMARNRSRHDLKSKFHRPWPPGSALNAKKKYFKQHIQDLTRPGPKARRIFVERLLRNGPYTGLKTDMKLQ